MFYDSRGRACRTVNPTGPNSGWSSASRHGRRSQLGDPAVYEPTPWETYTYDANDNAGRTHPGRPPTTRIIGTARRSIKIDALGRTVRPSHATYRARRSHSGTPDPYEMNHIRSNILTITDELGREALRHDFDFANRRLRLESIDAGKRIAVLGRRRSTN